MSIVIMEQRIKEAVEKKYADKVAALEKEVQELKALNKELTYKVRHQDELNRDLNAELKRLGYTGRI